MQLHNIQRIDDLSPQMHSVLTGTKRNPADQAMEILSRGGMGYTLQEIADCYSRGVRVLSENSEDPTNFELELLRLEDEVSEGSGLPIEAKTELIYLKGILNYISVEYGKQLLELAGEARGAYRMVQRTRGSVYIIQGSTDETDMRAALGK